MGTKRNNKKEMFLKTYVAKACNISETCRALGVKRKFYYETCKSDAEFEEKCREAEEGLVDFAESLLLKNMKAGKERSIIYYLNKKGKKRGYGEEKNANQGNTNVNIIDDI